MMKLCDKRLVARTALLVLPLASILAACHPAAPKGQVIAVVNGREITNQDLTAEARASRTNLPGPALLQRVIARELLADDAHAHRLDAYPGFPADMARLRSDFLAQRELRAVAKPPTPPTDAAIAQFIASQPYAFRDRTRLSVDDVKFQSADDLRSIQGLQNVDQVVARLKSLNVQYERQTQQLDTATMPVDLAARLIAAPVGELVIVRSPELSVALQVQDRQPISMSPEQQKAVARQLMVELASQREVEAVVNRLRSSAHIAYQQGFDPASKSKTSGSNATK